MSGVPLDEIEELAQCSVCRLAFDEEQRAPKLLSCRHHFCLACVRGALGGGAGLARCVHCGRRTPAPRGPAALPTHAPVLALARRLAAPARRRDLLLRALAAAAALRARLAAELAAPAERDRLRGPHAAAALRARLDDLVRAATSPLDFDRIRRALASPPTVLEPTVEPEPLLLLANFCIATLFARGLRSEDETNETNGDYEVATVAIEAPRAALATAFPLFFFELEVDGAGAGRVVVEVRADVAPRMARNFAALATGELGVGYRGCAVFQCWERESVITGDFELNNGRGGRSVFEESYFMPDDTGMAAVRGAVGMRRSQKRHDNLGLVGSQFRIVLREMRGFTAIFGFVVEGLDLVDRLSRTGDGAGKPHSSILIASCGKLN